MDFLFIVLSCALPLSLAICSVKIDAGIPVIPETVAGLNDVLGPIINLSYTDQALLRASDALGIASLRHPGGAVANYWSITNGSFVGADGTTAGCSNGTQWNFCKFAHRGDLPANAFTAKSYNQGIGAGLATVWDLNVFTLSLDDQLGQLEYMFNTGLTVHKIELGNEFYLQQYAWRFPSVQDYLQAIRRVVPTARRLFPTAKIAVVGEKNTGGWNDALASALVLDSTLFDAITVHDYSPDNNTVDAYPLQDQYSVVAGWGDASIAKIAQNVRASWPSGMEVWRTEFNYPTWDSGRPLLPLVDGALHGIYWASHVLASIQRATWLVPFPVMYLHAFLIQNGTAWDTEAGIVQVAQTADNVAAVRVNGVAQIFAHMAHVGMQHAQQHSLTVATTCPTLNLTIDGIAGMSCLMGAVFSGTGSTLHNTDPGSATTPTTVVLLNKCNDDLTVELQGILELKTTGDKTALDLANQTFETITYQASDVGGWTPLPTQPTVLPWPHGPLSPIVNTMTGDALTLLPNSLMFATVN